MQKFHQQGRVVVSQVDNAKASIFLSKNHKRKKGITIKFLTYNELFYDFYNINYHSTICKCTYISEKIFGLLEKNISIFIIK
jgi:hypothetical protein